MAVYKIQAPDGKIISLQGPDGASPADIIAQAQQLYKPQATAIPQGIPAPLDGIKIGAQGQGTNPAITTPYDQITPKLFTGGEEAQILPVEAPAVASPALVAQTPAPITPAAPATQNTALRPRYQDPVTTMGPFQADPSLSAGFVDTARNVARKQYELSGNVFDAGANYIDDTIRKIQFNLARLFIGDEEIDRRARENPAPDSIAPLEGNFITDSMRKQADQDFSGANVIAGQQAMNPVDRSGRTTIDQVFNDPTNLPQIGKFAVETAVESAPEMALAAVPGAGPVLFGGSMLQGTAEERAKNKGKEGRDVTGRELLESAPSSILSAIAERVGIKGLASKGTNAITRTGKAAVKEGATEAIQEPIELAGQTIGTDKEAKPIDYAKASVGGALGGVTTGGALKGSAEIVTAPFKEKMTDSVTFPQAPQQPSQGTVPPATEQATSGKVVNPTPPPEATAPTQAVPAQPVVTPPQAPQTQPVAPARPEGSEQVQPVESQQKKPKRVVTPTGNMEVDVNDGEIVSADDLVPAGGEFQPRNRDRAASDLQITKIANELDPERLYDSRVSDDGSPIIGQDNMIESGNGRIAALKLAKEKNPAGYERYLQSLRDRGYKIDGINNPVFVRRRTTELSNEDRIKFTQLSNEDRGLNKTETEKAQINASRIDDDVVSLHKGGDPDSIENRDFMRAFIAKMPSNFAGAAIGSDGNYTQEAIRAAKAAMVSKAYDDPDLVQNIFDSSDPEVKSVGNVLRDRAPEYAQLGAAVRAKEVPERFDISKKIMQAVKIIRDAKRDGKSVRDVIEGTKQISLIEEPAIDPVVEKLVRVMHRPELGRILAQPQLDKILRQYAVTAKEQKETDLFGENKTQPEDLLDAAYEKVKSEIDAKAGGQGSMLDSQPENINNSFDDSQASRAGKSGSSATPSGELAKTGGKNFDNFATSKGTTKYRTAYKDLGLDADVTVNQPAEKQLDILNKAMTDRFGVKIQISPRLDRRAALDILHNIYNNLSFLSGVLGIPYKAIGLSGTLGINLQDKLRGALGSYNPGTKIITLPKNTNSFIHEWLHALDDHLLNKFGNVSQGDLFSGVVRKDGTIDPRDGVQAAFANLMHAVFFDKAMLASIKLDLESKLQKAKTSSSKAEIEKKLKELEAGNYKGIKGKTNYYTSSRDFGNGNSYWTSPEEMLARVFEAYSAFKIEQAGGDATSIAKGDLAYLSNVDDRLAKTFPKLQERMVIFEAMDQFIARLIESEILGKDINRDQPMALDDMAILDVTQWGYFPPEAKPYKGLIKRIINEQKEGIADWVRMVNGLRVKMKEQKTADKNFKKSAMSLPRWIAQLTFSADRATMHALEKKYPASQALRQLNDRVFTRLSYGDSVVKDEFFEAARVPVVRFKNMISSIQTKAGKKFTEKELLNIRDILVSIKTNGTTKEREVAGQLRNLFDKMYDAMKSTGVDIGYLRNQGYLSRIYIKRKILANDDKFRQKAAEVYGIQFDQNIGDIAEEIAEDSSDFAKIFRRLLREDPGQLSITKKEAKELLQALKEGEELSDELKDRLQQILPQVRDFYSETAAKDWFNRILHGSEGDEFGSDAMSSGFTKKRALPPETEKIMEEFMETDPFMVADHYASVVGRRVGLAKAKKPVGKKSYDQLLKDMEKEGVSQGDIQSAQKIYDAIYNDSKKEESSAETAARTFLSTLRLAGTLTLLDLAAIASLAERFTVVIKTKNVLDTFKVVNYSIQQMLKTNDAKEAEFAIQKLGILYSNYYENDAISTRMGGGGADPAIIEYIGTQFFAKNGLTWIDNKSREVVARISLGHFKTISNILLDKKTSKANKDFALQDLKWYGINPEKAEEFALWMTGKGNVKDISFRNVNEWMQDEFGYDLMLAMNRFNNQTIQRPTAGDTPHYSKNMLGNLIYAVTRFSYAFWENIVKAESSRIKYAFTTHGAAVGVMESAKLALSMAPLLGVAAVVNALRVALFDNEKWEELEKNGEQTEYILKRTLSSSGLMGPVVDMMYNTWTGVRYQRDVATSVSGAYLSNYFKWIESFAALFGEANTDSNTREYNFIKETWKSAIAPSIAAVLAVAPGGRVLSPMEGLGIAGIGSSTLADNVAESIVGEKGNGKQKAGGSGEEPKTPKEPKEPKT